MNRAEAETLIFMSTLNIHIFLSNLQGGMCLKLLNRNWRSSHHGHFLEETACSFETWSLWWSEELPVGSVLNLTVAPMLSLDLNFPIYDVGSKSMFLFIIINHSNNVIAVTARTCIYQNKYPHVCEGLRPRLLGYVSRTPTPVFWK